MSCKLIIHIKIQSYRLPVYHHFIITRQHYKWKKNQKQFKFLKQVTKKKNTHLALYGESGTCVFASIDVSYSFALQREKK